MKRLLIACSFAALAAASPAHAASLIGNTVTCSQVGSGSFTCFTNSAVVGGGQEFAVGNTPTGFIGLNFNGGGLRISNISGDDFTLSATVLTLSNITSAFTGANLLNSSITGFNNSNVSLQNGVLRLNFIGSTWASNSSANIALETAAAVPEPGTWAMMLLGFGAMGAAMRSRRKQKITVRYA